MNWATICDGDGLTWSLTSIYMDGATGGECTEYQCRDHDRLTMMMQRPNSDADWTTTYHVDGILNYYQTAAEAIEAMRMNK
jgi:hypothetical protein